MLPFIKKFDSTFNALKECDEAGIKKHRDHALQAFLQSGLPGRKDENWKYTPIAEVFDAQYMLPISFTSNRKLDFGKLDINPDDINIVIVNGHMCPELSDQHLENYGIKLVQQSSLENLNFQPDQFVNLNSVLFIKPLSITLSKKMNDKLIVIHHCAVGSKLFLSPIISIKCEQGGPAVILEKFSSIDHQKYLTNSVTDFHLKNQSQITYCRLMDESLKATHIGATRVFQEEGSHFSSYAINLGSNLARHNLKVTLNGSNAKTKLFGLTLTTHKQHIDCQTQIDHKVSDCASHQLYKGILKDQSRQVFNGQILVRKDAQATQSFQLTKNLLLDKTCRVDAKPQLEIAADDVKCSHGATIGQLNQDEIFYLKSRGISEAQSRRMLTEAFAKEIFDDIDPQLLSRFSKQIHSKFNELK